MVRDPLFCSMVQTISPGSLTRNNAVTPAREVVSSARSFVTHTRGFVTSSLVSWPKTNAIAARTYDALLDALGFPMRSDVFKSRRMS